MIISRNAWIVVADGSRASIFENVGEIGEVSLKLLRSVDQHSTHKHDNGHDHTSQAAAGQGHTKSAQEPKAPHAAEKHDFLQFLIEGLVLDVQSGQCPEIVLIAGPTSLGALRQHLPAAVVAKVVKEVNKDYTHMTVNELNKTLMHLHD